LSTIRASAWASSVAESAIVAGRFDARGRFCERDFIEQLGWLPVLVGVAVATVSAALAIKWLVGFLNKHGLAPFGWYRLALCAAMATLIATGIVSF